MLINRNALLAGLMVSVLAGFFGFAQAGTPETHVLTLRLPDGRFEQVRYTGSVAPTVILVPTVPDPAFAMLARMTASMDGQVEALLRDIDASVGPGLGMPGFGIVPAMAGPGVCMHSVELTYSGNGRAPRVVSRTAGDCGPAQGEAAATVAPTPPRPDREPKLIEARDVPPHEGLVQKVRYLASSGRG